MGIQLTFEHIKFELSRSIYMWIFFPTKYVLQYYTSCGRLNLWFGTADVES